jgi:hypothetical protein
VPHDVIEPSLEEFRQRDARALKRESVIDVAPDFLHLLDNLGSTFGRYVLSDWFAGGGVAQMGHSHPKTIGTPLVNRSLVIRSAGNHLFPLAVFAEASAEAQTSRRVMKFQLFRNFLWNKEIPS